MSINEVPYPRFRWSLTVGLCLSLSALIFLLWTGHGPHVSAALPLLILAACPLMHLFMHRRHHHGGHRDQERS